MPFTHLLTQAPAYIAWADSRSEAEVYAMHLDCSGRPAAGWRTDGSPVCQQIGEVISVELVGDGAGGAFMAWMDARFWPGIPSPSNFSFLMLLTPSGPAAAPPVAAVLADASGPARAAPIGGSTTTLAVQGIEPNPSRGTSSVRFALADASPAMLELLDVAGRRMWSREVGSLGVGEHTVRLGGTAWIPPGVYLVRLTQGGRVASARLAIVR